MLLRVVDIGGKREHVTGEGDSRRQGKPNDSERFHLKGLSHSKVGY